MQTNNPTENRRDYYRQTLTEHQQKQLDSALQNLPEGCRDGLWHLLCNSDMQLNRDQHEALLHDHASEGPLLILAGAGSGKTAVMTRRIVFLLMRGADPESILAATFTNKAAREMKNRVRKIFDQITVRCSPEEQSRLRSVGERLEKAWIGTFHSLGKRILELSPPDKKRPLIRRIRGRYKTPIKLIDGDKAQKLLKTAYKEDPTNKSYTLQRLAERMYAWRDELVNPQSAMRMARGGFEEAAARLYKDYQLQKFRHSPSVVDFQDLLIYPTQILRSKEDARKFLQNKFQYVLIDEYQDTNYIQFLFCSLLAQKHNRLTAVGDDAQSIYGWRGADITNIQEFTDHFPGAKIVRLKTNYRSSVNIVMAANEIFGNSDEIYEKELTPGKGTAKSLEYGKPIAVFECLSDKEERGFLAYEIKRLVKNRGYNFGDIAVFYRLNRQSKAIKQIFEERDIPYVELGDRSFLSRKEVRLVECLLRILEGAYLNREGELNSLRIYDEALRDWWTREDSGFTGKYHRKIKNHLELFKVLINIPLQNKFKEKLPEQQKRFLEKELRLFVKLFEQIEQGARVIELVGEISEMLDIPSPEKNAKAMDFPVLFSDWLKATCDGSGFEGLRLFLENVEQQKRDPQFVPGNPDKFVKLSTLHGAKGLEFPVVFFTGLEEGVCPFLPPWKKKLDQKKLDEEKRLFYVGVTRAQERLNLLWSQQRFLFDKIRKQKKSKFLKTLPKNLTATVKPPRSIWQEIKAAFIR